MQNYERGYHLQLKIFETISTVSPLQRGFKLEESMPHENVLLSFKKYKYMCIILTQNALWDFITDSGLVLPKTLSLFLFFVATVVFS